MDVFREVALNNDSGKREVFQVGERVWVVWNKIHVAEGKVIDRNLLGKEALHYHVRCTTMFGASGMHYADNVFATKADAVNYVDQYYHQKIKNYEKKISDLWKKFPDVEKAV